MHVFLTGATGLVGSHVAHRVVREGGTVTCIHRAGSDIRFIEGLGCHLVEAEVTAPWGAIAAAMEGCTHLVHSAALVYASAGWPEVRRVNVDGTRNVLAAAARAGVEHAVHVSSVAVYARAADANEDTPLEDLPPVSSDYGRSKRESEQVVREVVGETGLGVSVVRPSAIYGERDRLLSRRVERVTRFPLTATLGLGRNTIPTVYAGNVADAIWLALQRAPSGEVFDVGLDYPLTQRMLLEGIARGLGRRPAIVPVPAGAAKAAADVLGRFGVSVPGARDLPLGRVVRLALAENPHPSTKIRDLLGWAPPHRHEDALVRTGEWLKAHPAVA